jgi:hypothetical protein
MSFLKLISELRFQGKLSPKNLERKYTKRKTPKICSFGTQTSGVTNYRNSSLQNIPKHFFIKRLQCQWNQTKPNHFAKDYSVLLERYSLILPPSIPPVSKEEKYFTKVMTLEKYTCIFA